MFLEAEKTGAETVSLGQVLAEAEKAEWKVRDSKDATFYAAVQIARPAYTIAGDRTPREDLLKSGAAKSTRAVTSKELLERLEVE